MSETALGLLRSGDWRAALASLEATPADDADWHAVRGMALLAGGDKQQAPAAAAAFAAAIARGDTTRETALNLALARAHAGDPTAIGAIKAVETAYPAWGEPPLRLAELARAAGEAMVAETAYRRAIARQPTADAFLRLATLLLSVGGAAEAAALLQAGCSLAPLDARLWDAIGLASLAAQDHAGAAEAFARAHALAPDSLAIALRLVATAVQRGDAERALAHFTEASAARPRDTVALAARARLLQALGRDREAVELAEAATILAPDDAALSALRGEHVLHTGHFAEAAQAMAAAVALDPQNPVLRNNLAVSLTRTHRYAEALAVLDQLRAEEGERLDMLCNRANTLVCLGRQAEGLADARAAVATAPDHPLALRTLANALAYVEPDGAVQSAAFRRVAAAAPRRLPPPRWPPLAFRDRHRRLRVGLLSANLRTHPVGWLTLPGWESLDPAAFDIVCIGGPEDDDPMQRRFRAIASSWHAWAERPPADLPARVRALDLDILVDLGGYGDQGLLLHCAERLAPVQIKWVGMQNHTTGMPEIDWLLTDRWETPEHLAHLYSEKLLVMPDGYVCYSPPPHAPPVAPPPAARSGQITFGCFNNLAKVTPLVIATWSQILAALPGARLILKTHQLGHAETAATLRDAFAAQGVAAGRLDLRGGSGHRTLLGEYGDVDIVLDPFPYSGGLTTCEALWMGVPVLTCPGESFASRHAMSHLCNVGLGDWVCDNLADYVSAAVARAGDIAALARLRAGLRAQMRASPLCDGPRFGRHLGAALRRAVMPPAAR